MKNLDPKRLPGIRVRMAILCGLLAVGFGTVLRSAWTIQVEDGSLWADLAEDQRQRHLHIQPKRGSIFDRNGEALAQSIEVPSVRIDAVELRRKTTGTDPEIEAKLRRYAREINEVLHLDEEAQGDKPARRGEEVLFEKFHQKRRFLWLKRRISEAELIAIKKLVRDPVAIDQARAAFKKTDATPRFLEPYSIPGLAIEGEAKRFYPNRELAAHVLGFVSPDGEGKEGLEKALDQDLRGQVAELRGLRDRQGKALFTEGLDDERALAGHDLHLTIDKAIQFTAERELAAAMQTYEASGGSLVAMDPQTGEILALANVPLYNPNDPTQSPVEARRNRAVVDRFEPGSTMKVFAVSTALANRTVSPTSTFDCNEGKMEIDGQLIHDTHENKVLSVTQILAVSSNVGAAQIALGLGEPRLYEGYRRFGFGEVTGLPLPGETSGVLRSRGRPWVRFETASAAFGQGISVSAVQLATAMAAVANDGKLVEPILVKRVTDGTGALISETGAHVRRTVIPAGTARLMSEMLVSVTEGEGTGIEAGIDGFRVAGKTATAQKYDPSKGRYTDEHFVASFAGFVPADKPRLVMAVVLDEPMGGTHAGGAVTAPVFRRVGEMALRYLGVTPRGTAPVKLSEVAEAAAARNAQAAAGTSVSTQPIVVAAGTPREGQVRVPDLSGFPPRDAVKSAVGVGLSPSVEGTGRLARQEPPPGSIVPKGAHLKLVFEPPT